MEDIKNQYRLADRQIKWLKKRIDNLLNILEVWKRRKEVLEKMM